MSDQIFGDSLNELLKEAETYEAYGTIVRNFKEKLEKNSELKQYDVKAAYLNGTVDEELYTRQQPGFAASGQEELVCRLTKSIYGMRHPASCWNKALDSVLRDLRFQQCDSDSCLYVRLSGTVTVYILVYVDDLIIGCTDEDEINRVYSDLQGKFDFTDLGPVRFFLGFEVEQEDGFYSLRLTSYIEQLVSKFGMNYAAPVKTPMNPGYICVGLLGRKVNEPNQSDWAAAKRVLHSQISLKFSKHS